MKYLLTGGGTGGHIYPAVAIADEIKRNDPDAEILFVGTKNGLESELVPKSGYELKTIRVKGFKRKISIDIFKTINTAFKGLFDARLIINDFKPDIVIGTGGYVCGPVVMMAILKGVPTIIHEQNAFPGITNRILSGFVNKVAVAFEDSKKYFPCKRKIVVTGNPIRTEVLSDNKTASLKKLSFKDNIPLVVSVGGSRGAEKINESMVDFIKYIDENIQVLIITGSKQYDAVLKKINNINADIKKNVKVIPYCYNMKDVYAAADLIICRAGAITLAELTATGTPSILIPSPNVTHNHQEYNAKVLVNNKAAEMIIEKDLTGKLLFEKVNNLLKNPIMLEKMKSNAKKMAKIDAVKIIYGYIKRLV